MIKNPASLRAEVLGQSRALTKSQKPLLWACPFLRHLSYIIMAVFFFLVTSGANARVKEVVLGEKFQSRALTTIFLMASVSWY